ncbi:DUF4893 domain-containing protein [Parasphingopyxis sp.]|uniref:DUF4893 domain-containing protein n=1 Tax=Parasphingopyxis sp. TaxID=1920299 RepID=UPI00260CA8AB|nr:DUF4893 domain-containing protein [Parasphingopyxis sp.]
MTGRVHAILAAITAALLTASCAYTTGVTGTPAGANPDQELPTIWRSIATDDDRQRISNVRRSFREGVADAAAGGHAHEVAQEGILLQPDAGRADPRPPAGYYRCRFVKLGSQGSVPLSFVAYPWFRCRIDDQGETLRFVKLTGSQRPSGTFYPDNRLRMIFLGVLVLGDETRAHVYGRDTTRDMAGILERIGDARWRIVLPYPRFESLVDVIELVPEDQGSAG